MNALPSLAPPPSGSRTEVLPEVEPLGESATATELAPLYQLILFDDDEHTYQYVCNMLTDLFGMSYREAYDVAYDVDYLGQAVVKVCPLEEALVGKERIMNYGPDHSLEHSNGSMLAMVQEVSE